MQENEGLETWRKEIRAIDQEMISMSARRMELALKIGQYKAEHRLPVKDFRVEKEIIERTRSLATTLGLAPDFAEDLMTLVMGHSVKEQNKLHQSKRSEIHSTLKEVLVIGGLGRMGRWFSQYFQSIGFQVFIHDKKIENLPDSFQRHENLEEDLDRYELIFLTTPMQATEELLEKLAAKPPRGMVVETSSLKTPVRKGLKTLSAKGVKVASIHPMFGPDTDLLVDKNILICQGEGLSSDEAAALYFHSTSAELVKVDIETHDKDMLSTLGLVHIINLIFGMSLSKNNLSIEDAWRRGGSSFLEQLKTTRVLFSENPDLYFDIQEQNPYRAELYEEIHSVFERLRDLVEAGDRPGFLSEIRSTAKFLQGKDPT